MCCVISYQYSWLPYFIVLILTLDETLYLKHLHQPENSVSCFQLGQRNVPLLPTPGCLKRTEVSSIPASVVRGRLKCSRWQWVWFWQKMQVSVQYLHLFRHKRMTQSLMRSNHGFCSQAAHVEVLAHWELQACGKDRSHLRIFINMHIYWHKLNGTPYLKKISHFLGHFPN